MKLSNTRKHFMVGFIAGFITMIALQWVAVDIKVPIGWFILMFWTACTIAWEYCQYWHYGRKLDYWQNRGWDTFFDLLAGNLPFWIMTLAGMYGHYAVTC